MCDCDFAGNCEFRKRLCEVSLDLADSYDIAYCRTAFAECARFRVASAVGLENVPPGMWPSEMDRAEQVIRKVLKGGVK